MKVKVKHKGRTLHFDSQVDDIAVLFTPKDKEAVENMEHNDLLLLSAPFSSMHSAAAEVWRWAFNGWPGVTKVDLDRVKASKGF